MFRFWCSVCIDDKDMYASSIDDNWAYATCPDCGTALKEQFARHRGITDQEMTTESYIQAHGLDTTIP